MLWLKFSINSNFFVLRNSAYSNCAQKYLCCKFFSELYSKIKKKESLISQILDNAQVLIHELGLGLSNIINTTSTYMKATKPVDKILLSSTSFLKN